MKEADRKATQVHYKKSKRQGELRKEIYNMSHECDELKKRIKVKCRIVPVAFKEHLALPIKLWGLSNAFQPA